MNKDYLLEIGCEEIPARFMSKLLNDLKQSLEETLKNHRFSYNNVECFGTYRRLTVIVKKLASKQENQTQKIKGPPAAIALDSDGKYLMPAIGFAKKVQILPEELICEVDHGASYIYAIKKEMGKTVKDILPGVIPEVINNLPLPIAMRWGSDKKSFIRPIHWIVSLYGKDIIPFNIYNISASRISYGHRFLTKNKELDKIAHGAQIVLSSVGDYITALKRNNVVIDQLERKIIINNHLIDIIDKNNIDTNLVEEVVYLSEEPKPLTGYFSEEYLSIPKEILIQCMKKQQKFFPVVKNNKLKSQFVVIADNVTDSNCKNILVGNENVLKARFEDVKYFWAEDQKIKLKDLLPKLKKVIFQKDLGSIYDKVIRIEKIAKFIIKQLDLKKSEKQIMQTAQLCKTDLISHTVYELPNLQGTIGRLCAEKENLDPEICKGIEEHYLPRFQGDQLPSSLTGIIVGLSDRLDTVVSSFYNNLIPTGSQDPWGIRRAIYAVFQISYRNKIDLNFEACIDFIFNLLGGQNNKAELLAFFKQRTKSFLIDQEFNYDNVDAVLDIAMSRFLEAAKIISAIESIRSSNPDQFKGLVDTAVRIKRLAVKYEKGKVSAANFQEVTENNSWKAYLDIVKELEDSSRNAEKILLALTKLTKPMTEYFDNILIMSDDNKLRANRLAFLNKINQLYLSYADFEKIVI